MSHQEGQPSIQPLHPHQRYCIRYRNNLTSRETKPSLLWLSSQNRCQCGHQTRLYITDEKVLDTYNEMHPKTAKSSILYICHLVVRTVPLQAGREIEKKLWNLEKKTLSSFKRLAMWFAMTSYHFHAGQCLSSSMKWCPLSSDKKHNKILRSWFRVLANVDILVSSLVCMQALIRYSIRVPGRHKKQVYSFVLISHLALGQMRNGHGNVQPCRTETNLFDAKNLSPNLTSFVGWSNEIAGRGLNIPRNRLAGWFHQS